MPYIIEFSSRARRQLSKLPSAAKAAVRARVDSLASNPRPAGTKRMAGDADRYRLRVGEYRVVYEIRDQVLVVLVLAVGHRKNVYKDG